MEDELNSSFGTEFSDELEKEVQEQLQECIDSIKRLEVGYGKFNSSNSLEFYFRNQKFLKNFKIDFSKKKII